MAEEKVTVYDGKYEFYMKNHYLHCLRYGEEWRDFIGDGAVLQLFLHAIEQEEQLEKHATLSLLYSHCNKHDTYPKDDEPCWQCINEFETKHFKEEHQDRDGVIESVKLAILASVEEKPVLICSSILLDWADRLDGSI